MPHQVDHEPPSDQIKLTWQRPADIMSYGLLGHLDLFCSIAAHTLSAQHLTRLWTVSQHGSSIRLWAERLNERQLQALELADGGIYNLVLSGEVDPSPTRASPTVAGQLLAAVEPAPQQSCLITVACAVCSRLPWAMTERICT